ncbi:cytochrome B561, N terminal-domain-containing protein [Chytriomyces cf. hyalinus JEL632]|nr:cytochrome B561, N terminal-domain-containing protein [Chytriomyces cf. hyalinus JEL632]
MSLTGERQTLSAAKRPPKPATQTPQKPAAVPFRGVYESNAMRALDKARVQQSATRFDGTRLVWNAALLGVVAAVWKGRYLESILPSEFGLVSWALMPFLGIAVLNIAIIAWNFFGSNDAAQLDKVPLTPREKVLMGLDTSTKLPPLNATPTSTPKYTPSKSFFRPSVGTINSSSKPSGSLFATSTPLSRASQSATANSTPFGNTSNQQSQFVSPTSGVPAGAASSVTPMFVSASPLASHLLATSPSIRDSPPIRDKTMLQRLINESMSPSPSPLQQVSSQQFNTPSSSPFYSSPSLGHHFSSPSAMPHATSAAAATLHTMPISNSGKFQPATPSKPNTASSKQPHDRVEGGFVIKAPSAVVSSLAIDNGVLDRWGEGMRWWMSGKVVKAIASRVEAWEESAAKEGMDHLGVSAEGAVWNTAAWGVCNPVASAGNTAAAAGSLMGPSGFGSSAAGGLFAPKSTSGFGGFGQTQQKQSMFGASTSSFGGFGGGSLGGSLQTQQNQAKPTNLLEFQQRFGQTPLCQERLKIEQYLNIPDYNCRPYILERIQALSKSGGLASYNWNVASSSSSAGSNMFGSSLSSVMEFFTSSQTSFDRSTSSNRMGQSVNSMSSSFNLGPGASSNFPGSSNSTGQADKSAFSASVSTSGGGAGGVSSKLQSAAQTKVPSDAQILVHLVCTFFDEQMGWGPKRGFTSKYFVGIEGKPDPSVSIQILEKTRSPVPHYNLFYRNRIYEVYPKRNNVFHMFSIFAYIVSTTAGGYLGLLNLGGKSVGMVTETGILDGPARSAFLEEEEERRRKSREGRVSLASSGNVLSDEAKENLNASATAAAPATSSLFGTPGGATGVSGGLSFGFGSSTPVGASSGGGKRKN